METNTNVGTQRVKGLFSDFLTAVNILHNSKKLNQLDMQLEGEEGSLDAFFNLLNVVGYNLFQKPTHPPFVVLIEGLDGTGKTTLVNSLAEQTHEIEGRNFNGYAVGTPTASVASVRDIFDKCGGLVSRAFYMVSNYILQHEMRIKSERDPFSIFFVDRWYSSTCAYSIGWKNTSGGPESVDALDASLFEWPKDLDVPDLMIVLHVDGKIRRERIRLRGELLNHNPWDDRLTKDDDLGKRIVRAWERMSGPRKTCHLSANQCKDDVLRESQKIIRESMFRQFLPVQYFRHNPLRLFRWKSSYLGHCDDKSGLRCKHTTWNYHVCLNDASNGKVSLQNHEIHMVDNDGILSFSTDYFESLHKSGGNALASAAWVQGEYPKEYRWRADGVVCMVSESQYALMDITPQPGLMVYAPTFICEWPRHKDGDTVNNEEVQFSHERIPQAKVETESSKFATRFIPLRMVLETGRHDSQETSHSNEWVRDRNILENEWSGPRRSISVQSSHVLHGKKILPVTLAILGTHASGKRTLGERLATIFGWSFHPELGDILRDKDKIVAAGHRTGDGRAKKEFPDMAWDDRIYVAESERDRATACSRVVETWHVGNIAWTLFRLKVLAASGQNVEAVIERSKSAIKSELKKAVVLLVHLRVDVETSIRRRQIEGNSKRIPMKNEFEECEELHEALDVQGATLLSEIADLSIPVLRLDNSEDGDKAIEKSLRQIVHFVNRNLWRMVL